MNEAWSILNLSSSASEEEIRRRYLELVREFSPERDPDRFTEIRKAYDELRDPIKRVESQLFDQDEREDLGDLIDEFKQSAANVRIPTSTLLDLANNN